LIELGIQVLDIKWPHSRLVLSSGRALPLKGNICAVMLLSWWFRELSHRDRVWARSCYDG